MNLPTNTIVLDANSNPNSHLPISEGLQNLLQSVDNENIRPRPSSVNNVDSSGASALPTMMVQVLPKTYTTTRRMLY